MCGRYSLITDAAALRKLFGFNEEVAYPPRYNIAPTQPIGVIHRHAGNDPAAPRHFTLMRWGLVPSWVKDPGNFQLLFNARSETVEEKPAFRAAWRYRRCLIPADGFYEWQRRANGKQAFWIPASSGEVVAFAGLYETWLGANGSEIDTACILTTTPNAELAPIHDRMPVTVRPEDFEFWLGPQVLAGSDAARLLAPAPDGFFRPIPVGAGVNAARNDGPDLQRPVEIADATAGEPVASDVSGEAAPARRSRRRVADDMQPRLL